MKQILIVVTAAVTCMGWPTLVSAQSTPAPDAPDYFVQAVFETTTAQRLAQSCSDLSFHIQAASVHSGIVMGQMEEAGIDVSTPGLELNGFAEKMAALQQGFITKYGLDADSSLENACRAGRMELETQSGIGRFLEDVAE